MKKKRKVSLVLITLFVFTVIMFFVVNKPMNDCYIYTKEYLGEMPVDGETIKEIDNATSKCVNPTKFKMSVYFSRYLKRYIVDKFFYHLDKKSGNEAIITSYYNELVVMRLKIHLIKGEEKEFSDLFYKTFYDLDTCWLSVSFYDDLVKDENYSIQYRDKQYQIISNTYLSMLKDCDDLQRFFINESLIKFYSKVYGADEELEDCSQMRQEIIERVGMERIKQEILKRNNLDDFTNSLDVFK